MFVSQTALKICDIWLAHRRICRKFNRGALYESACCHDDLIFVARHIPRNRRNEAVNRRCRLNPFAKSNQLRRVFKFNGLNDIRTNIPRFRRNLKTELLKSFSAENRAFQRSV